jgi:Domain of unknown function (DUF397)
VKVEHLYPEPWRRASFCASGECVEVSFRGDLIRVRGTNDYQTPNRVLTYTRDEWGAFIAGVKAGEFDL